MNGTVLDSCAYIRNDTKETLLQGCISLSASSDFHRVTILSVRKHSDSKAGRAFGGFYYTSELEVCKNSRRISFSFGNATNTCNACLMLNGVFSAE